jgi:hypothetical protein
MLLKSRVRGDEKQCEKVTKPCAYLLAKQPTELRPYRRVPSRPILVLCFLHVRTLQLRQHRLALLDQLVELLGLVVHRSCAHLLKRGIADIGKLCGKRTYASGSQLATFVTESHRKSVTLSTTMLRACGNTTGYFPRRTTT